MKEKENASRIRVGVIGCGHWGKNYLRVFSSLPDAELSGAVDLDPERLTTAGRTAKEVATFSDYRELLKNGLCDAVVVATTASSHYSITKDALESGLHVLVEKPFTLTIADAENLVRLAESTRKTLMVAHTFLYNPSVRRIKQYLQEGLLGDVYYIKARRTHLGLIREDVNVIWDLAPHDISMFLYFLQEEPSEVQVMGRKALKSDREDAAFINLAFPSGVIGNIVVSWADSNKERWIDIVGSRSRILFDDLSTLEPVRIFYRGGGIDDSNNVSFGEFKYLVRDGEILSPRIEVHEPLKVLCESFLESIRTQQLPLSDGSMGKKVVSVLCKIDEALKKQNPG